MQYRISAGLTLAALRDETLEWIGLADPEAGTLDDFQLARHGRLDAYQVKFSGAPRSFTYAKLSEMLPELAGAWKQLREAHPDREVFAHLHTSQPPSRHPGVSPLGSPPPSPKHFASFLEAVWQPIQRGEIHATTAIPSGWLPAWEGLREKASFGRREFLEFVRHLHLDLDQAVPEVDGSDASVDPDLRRRYQELLWEIQQIVTDPERKVRRTRTELILALGWANEFEFKSPHEFAIRRDRYARNAESTADLLAAVDALEGGYLAMVGAPGSGKSTLLTDAFYGHPDVVARYYAYIPDNEIGRATRASAPNFLHDVVLSLERAGFKVGETPVGFDTEVLRERLRRQLGALGDRFRSTGQRSYILVDGLDHVDRVIRPGSTHETLLDYLPDPDAIPQGVFLVLGTQRTDVIPEPVASALGESERVVSIKPLPRADVLVLATESEVVPTGTEETVYRISNGHPLIVAYILAGLEAAVEAERKAWLAQLPAVDGDVLALYRSYWSDVEADDNTVELLALVGRWRGPIDLEWFVTWLDPAAIRRVRRTAAHFFRKESDNRWYFFHESFRVFLLEQTIKTADGAADERIALRYHHELAGQCGVAEEGPIRWEQLHHLIEAEDYAAALELARPTIFRAQADALRALPAIRVDIREAARVAIRRRDLTALACLTLAAYELGGREFHLDWSDSLALLLIELGEGETALGHLRGDFALRESKNVTLRAALLLHVRNFETEARRLFDLAEPLDILRGNPEHYAQADAEIETLFAWAGVAPYFRPLDTIAAKIRALRVESFGYREHNDVSLARHCRAQLLAAAGIGALDAGKFEEVDTLLEQFDRSDEEEATAWVRLVMHRFRAEPKHSPSARRRLEAALREVEPQQLADWMRLAVAEEFYFLGDADTSRRWLASLDPPSPPEIPGVNEGIRPYWPLLRFHRLAAAHGLSTDPAAITKPRNHRFTRLDDGVEAIIRLANLWGDAWAGNGNADDFLQVVKEIIGVLDARVSRNDLGWYAIEAARPELFAQFVHAAADVDAKALDHLKALFIERWLDKNPPDDDEVRHVLLAFRDDRGTEAWMADELSRYEPQMLNDKDVTGQIDACFAQARAWLRLGHEDKATKNALLGVARSSGVGYRKDYQLNIWIGLMGPLLREPAQEAEVEWLARAIARLDESTEGGASRLAAEELLRQTAAAQPRSAVRILRTLPEHGFLTKWDALAAFLEGLTSAGGDALAWICLTEVLVATARSAKVGSLRVLAAATESGSLSSWLETVNRRVGVHALPTTRLYWRRELATIAATRGIPLDAIGLTADDLNPSDRAPKSIWEEPSGSERSRADEVRTPAELLAILDEDLDEYGLRAAIERISDQLSRDEIPRIANALRATDHAALTLELLARCLTTLGDRATARELAEEAIAAGRPSGWVRIYDGGTRIRPLEALAQVDAAAAQGRLWELLETDAEDESFNPGALADSFHTLISIADAAQAGPIASMVRDHVRSLLSTTTAIDELAAADDVPPNDTAAACAALLVDSLIDSNYIRADAGARGCIKAATAAIEPMLRLLAEAARGGEEAARRALHVLVSSALLSGETESLRSIANEIAASTDSEDCRQLAEPLIAELTAQRPAQASNQHADVSLLGLVNRPVQRPAEIRGGPPRETNAEEWLAATAAGADDTATHVDSDMILGEWTTLVRLEWDLPNEHREQTVVRADVEQCEIPCLYAISMLGYHTFGEGDGLADKLRDSLVFRFTEPGHDPWRSFGIALNPLVARDLGWLPSGGLLAWEDVAGRPTCRSLWWRDGHRDHEPPSFDDMVGEGWVVVASPEAVRQIVHRFGRLERRLEITRNACSRCEALSARRRLVA